jgi:hypothetical protein
MKLRYPRPKRLKLPFSQILNVSSVLKASFQPAYEIGRDQPFWMGRQVSSIRPE